MSRPDDEITGNIDLAVASGGERIGAITEMPINDFKGWLKNGDMTKPVGRQSVITGEPPDVERNRVSSGRDAGERMEGAVPELKTKGVVWAVGTEGLAVNLFDLSRIDPLIRPAPKAATTGDKGAALVFADVRGEKGIPVQIDVIGTAGGSVYDHCVGLGLRAIAMNGAPAA